MAAKNRTRKSKDDGLKYLVVRGTDRSTVYIVVAPPPVTNATLATLVDNYSSGKAAGVVKTGRAVLIDGKGQAAKFCGDSLHPPNPKSPSAQKKKKKR